MESQVAIDRRCEGIPGVTLGGYVAGLAAKSLGPSVIVTLNRPVPPGAVVMIETTGLKASLQVNGDIAASAVEETFPSTVPKPVDPVAAAKASEQYLGFTHHFFPNCFTCGPRRQEGEGLRVFPGAVAGRPLVACVWQPPPFVRKSDDSIGTEYLWAALDCPAIWAAILHGKQGPDDRAVTGRLALRRYAAVPAAPAHIIMGWPIERDGRKVVAGAALLTTTGGLLVESRQTLILTDRGVPLHRLAWLSS